VRKHLLLSVTLASSLLAGCQQTKAPVVELPEAIPAQSFRRDWAANLQLDKGDAIDRLFVREDIVFVYTQKNMAFALNKAGGVIRFSAMISDSIVKPHPPIVLKERIVFPTDSTLEIYRRDGLFERSFRLSSSVRTDAVGWTGGSRVFFGVDSPGSGRLISVETSPGQYKPVSEKWALMSSRGEAINSAPAFYTGVVYASFDDGEVYAVNADNRQPIWSTSTGQTFKTYGPVNAALRVDDFGLYVPSTDSKLYCLDKTQGKKKWEYYAGTSLRSDPEVTATMVYLPVTGRGIVAIDKLNGPAIREPRWICKDAVKLVSEDEKYAYFSRADNIIIAIDKLTGEQRFTSKRTDLVAFATNTKDAIIYAGTKDGQVIAITPVLKPGNVGEIAMDNARPMNVLAMR
jgi:outer membrane protein assembly factor BamB